MDRPLRTAPGNQFNPKNPLNPLNEYHPTTPFQSLNSTPRPSREQALPKRSIPMYPAAALSVAMVSVLSFTTTHIREHFDELALPLPEDSR